MSIQNHDTKEQCEGYRIVAVFVDFFLFFTVVALILAPIFNKARIGDFALITLGVLLLWETLVRQMPGKWLLKLDIHYEKEDKKKFRFYLLRSLLKYLLNILDILYSVINRRQLCLHDHLCGTVVKKKSFWIRPVVATVYFLVGLNLYMTVGCGTVFWQETKKDIPLDRVNMLPQPFTITSPGFSESTTGIWVWRLRFRLPRYYKSAPLESSIGYNGYTLTTSEGKYSSISIYDDKLLHPYRPCLCGLNILHVDCSGTPRDVQERVFHSTTNDFFTAWNYIRMIRLQGRLHAKGYHLSGKGDAFFLRKLSVNGISIIWVFKDKLSRMASKSAPDGLLYDYIFMATDTNYWVLEISWNGIPRDEELVKGILLSVKEEEQSEQASREEMQLAKEQGSVAHAVNALRMWEDFENAQLLYEVLCLHGTPEEKSSFAGIIKYWSEYRTEFKKLVPITQNWRLE